MYLGKAIVCTIFVTIIWVIAAMLMIIYREAFIIPIIVAVIITFFTLRRVINEVPLKQKPISISALQLKELFESLNDDELDVLRDRLSKNSMQEHTYSNDLISERKAKHGET